MNIFNYKNLTFSRQHGENFDLMSMAFLDYDQEIREVSIMWNSIGRKTIWLAQFSGLTTEYSGSLYEVLEAVVKHVASNEFKLEKSK